MLSSGSRLRYLTETTVASWRMVGMRSPSGV